MKKFTIEFRHRENGTLDQVFETIETTSKAKATRWGKAEAAARGWWFNGILKAPHA